MFRFIIIGFVAVAVIVILLASGCCIGCCGGGNGPAAMFHPLVLGSLATRAMVGAPVINNYLGMNYCFGIC